MSKGVYLSVILAKAYQGYLTFSLAAEVVDKSSNFYTIHNSINRSGLNALNSDWHAQHHSCRIADERKKPIISRPLFHSVLSNQASLRLVMAIEILVMAYVR
jgi:hypothetical protein